VNGHEVGRAPDVPDRRPCVPEGRGPHPEIAGAEGDHLRLGVPFIFKASYDKAKARPGASFRARGSRRLKILGRSAPRYRRAGVTDVQREDTPLAEVPAVVDVLQTPAFLVPADELLVNTASQGKPVNIKKGQFISPWERQNVVDKAAATGNEASWCASVRLVGYNNLKYPTCARCRSASQRLHGGVPPPSVQLPGGQGSASGGQRDLIRCWRRAAVAAGEVAGLFMETHPNPAASAVERSTPAARAHGAAPRHAVTSSTGGEESAFEDTAVRKSRR